MKDDSDFLILTIEIVTNLQLRNYMDLSNASHKKARSSVSRIITQVAMHFFR